MEKELVINVTGSETRMALLENGQIEEIFIERGSRRDGMVGTIYKGRVKKILPGMQSAFVDIGLEKDSFLYVSDVDPRLENIDFLDDEFFETPSENNGRRGRKNKTLKNIDELLEFGQEILIQITKEPIGSKGARVTTHLSIPGTYAVLMPTVNHIGVSRKIRSFNERKRLREVVKKFDLENMGLILRTAAEDRTEKELKRDIKNLIKIWKMMMKNAEKAATPSMVYEEEDLIIRTIRDLISSDFKAIHIDGEKEAKRLRSFLSDFSPRHKKIINYYSGNQPIFEYFGIEERLQKLFRNKVWLKSGGHVVINQTEALVAIDINTGKFVGSSNLEDTIIQLNLEAIEEIVRQIRLRDLGGILIIDFIDMENKHNRKKVINAFYKEMQKDRAQYKILPINEFGLLQLTRRRVKRNLSKILTRYCPYCDGTGSIKSNQTVCYEIQREIIKLKPHLSGKELIVRAHPEIIETFRIEEHDILSELEKNLKKKISLREEDKLHRENFDIMSI